MSNVDMLKQAVSTCMLPCRLLPPAGKGCGHGVQYQGLVFSLQSSVFSVQCSGSGTTHVHATILDSDTPL